MPITSSNTTTIGKNRITVTRKTQIQTKRHRVRSFSPSCMPGQPNGFRGEKWFRVNRPRHNQHHWCSQEIQVIWLHPSSFSTRRLQFGHVYTRFPFAQFLNMSSVADFQVFFPCQGSFQSNHMSFVHVGQVSFRESAAPLIIVSQFGYGHQRELGSSSLR